MHRSRCFASSTITLLMIMALGSTAVPAADLGLRLVDPGSGTSAVTVEPSATLSYQVVGELTAADNQGLALVVFDLEFDGGPLAQVTPPIQAPMSSFVPPSGHSPNPDGYAGTVQGGRLVQVGGSQNFAGHGSWSCLDSSDCPGGAACTGGVCSSIPGLPTGSLHTGVALPGSPVVVATGTLTAPATEGIYTLHADNVRATVVRSGSTGIPFWATEAVDGSIVTDLVITVQAQQQQPAAIPTLSTWGLVLTTLLLITLGAYRLRRSSISAP